MVGFIIYVIVIGIIAGYLARLLVPGPDPMGFFATVLLGIVGSFVGGILGSLIFQGELTFAPSGIIASIIGAIIVLLIYRFATRRGGGRRRTV